MAETARTRATDAMMAVSRTMTAVVARTLTDVAAEVTVPQLRVLVLIDLLGPMNVRTLAEHLAVNPSNASRTCSQLVTSGRLVRQQDDDDGRHVRLALSAAGEDFVRGLMSSRRELIDGVVARMDPADQVALADAIETFTAAVAAASPEGAAGLSAGGVVQWLP